MNFLDLILLNVTYLKNEASGTLMIWRALLRLVFYAVSLGLLLIGAFYYDESVIGIALFAFGGVIALFFTFAAFIDAWVSIYKIKREEDKTKNYIALFTSLTAVVIVAAIVVLILMNALK